MIRSLVGFCAAAIAVALVAVTPAAAQTGRVAYINVQRVLAEAPGTTDAQQAFERDMQSYRTELEGLENELEALQTSFDRQQATMTPDVREQHQTQMQQKFIAYQQRQAELEETLQRRQSELLGPIMDRIISVTEQVRAEGNYAMIFDAAAGGLVTADPALDISDQILQRMRSTP